MANFLRIWKQNWTNVKHTIRLTVAKEKFMGQDQYGNKYFERPQDSSRNIKLLRRVEPLSKDQAQVPRVPAEWMTWLQKRRDTPPTEQEISENFNAMLKTQHLAKSREASEKALEHDKLSEQGKEEPASDKERKRDFPKYPDLEIHSGHGFEDPPVEPPSFRGKKQ